MHLDIALDQLGPFRSTRALANHRRPAGGIAGTPGRLAARAVLKHDP